MSNMVMRYAWVLVIARYWMYINFHYDLYLTIFIMVEAFRYV
jgi:hypothetical protein